MARLLKHVPSLVLAGACALARGAPVCERAGVEIREDGVRCQTAGVLLFADAFADTNAWPVVRNYENRLRLAFGHPARGGGSSLLVSGEDTPKCDTAWNVMTAPRPFAGQGDRYRLSFRVATTSAVRTAAADTQGWWTSVRWQDAAGRELAADRVAWTVPAGAFNEVRHEGAIPVGAATFAVQLGFDGPNVCEGRCLEVGDVRLEALDGSPRRRAAGWFHSEAAEGGPVSWVADVPPGCAVRFQAASADTLEELASAPFRGPDGTAATYWTEPFTPPGAWVRYRAELVSDGTATPVLRTVTVGGRVDRAWTAAGDGEPPRVRLLMPSPTTDARVPLKIGISDDSALDWNSLRVVVDGADATARLSREGNVLSLVDQASPWTNGIHCVDVDVKDWHGNAARTHKRFFIGEAPKTPRVSLRDDGITLVDGVPFFPVGIYGVMRREFNAYDFDRAFADLKAGGFNFAHSYSSPDEDDFLDAAWRHGIRVWNVARFPDRRFIEVERHHPAILAWYLGDDTSDNTAPERLRDYDEAVKAVDPTRITTQADGVGAGASVSNYGPFVDGTDNFLAEIYPVHWTNRNDGATCVARVIQDMKRVRADVAAHGGTRPRSCWPIIQYFKGWGWERFPTRTELDAMSFASLIHGGHGITWYTYGGTVEPERKKFNYGVTTSRERWTNMTNLATRISSLAPVFVERTGPQPPEPEVEKGPKRDPLGNASVSCLLKRHDGKAYLFAVNSAPEPVEAAFRLEGVAPDGDVRWEARKVSLRDGVLRDRFAPFAVHVYEFAAR